MGEKKNYFVTPTLTALKIFRGVVPCNSKGTFQLATHMSKTVTKKLQNFPSGQLLTEFGFI